MGNVNDILLKEQLQRESPKDAAKLKVEEINAFNQAIDEITTTINAITNSLLAHDENAFKPKARGGTLSDVFVHIGNAMALCNGWKKLISHSIYGDLAKFLVDFGDELGRLRKHLLKGGEGAILGTKSQTVAQFQLTIADFAKRSQAFTASVQAALKT